jgi:cytochrome c oxidase subunit III
MTAHNKTSALRLGLIIFAALAVLTAFEFALAYFLADQMSTTLPVILLVLVAVTKAGLVIYYYMHIYRLFEADETPPGERNSYAYKLATNRLGLWLFMLSDAFIFGGLMLSRINLLGMTRPELNQFLGLGVTSILLVSSFFAYRAEVFIGLGNRKQFLTSLAITMSLGILFLVGVVGVEWQIAPFGPADSIAGAIFYVMTGFHAFHVLTGVIFLGIVLRNGRRGCYSAEKHWGVEASVVYWHFIDVVWFFFYPALYLIGVLK